MADEQQVVPDLTEQDQSAVIAHLHNEVASLKRRVDEAETSAGFWRQHHARLVMLLTRTTEQMALYAEVLGRR